MSSLADRITHAEGGMPTRTPSYAGHRLKVNRSSPDAGCHRVCGEAPLHCIASKIEAENAFSSQVRLSRKVQRGRHRPPTKVGRLHRFVLVLASSDEGRLSELIADRGSPRREPVALSRRRGVNYRQASRMMMYPRRCGRKQRAESLVERRAPPARVRSRKMSSEQVRGGSNCC